MSRTTLQVDAGSRGMLAGADLSNANLDVMTLIGEPADFTGTVFDGASMQQASLELADFTGASLANVDAQQASFRGARFFGHDGKPAATFSGQKTDLTNAIFIGADVSGVPFIGATLSGAAFNGARALNTNFNGITGPNVVFYAAHISGADAFKQATDLSGADFVSAVLVGNVNEDGGLDFTGTDLSHAKFDGAQCIGCNFSSATLTNATFPSAYLLGTIWSAATLSGVDFSNAWFYCGDMNNSRCQPVQNSPDRWQWPLALGFGEASGSVTFPIANLNNVSFAGVKLWTTASGSRVTRWATCGSARARQTRATSNALHLTVR
jgi:uncharacterized protein YjbI with pentapeptide repeats